MKRDYSTPDINVIEISSLDIMRVSGGPENYSGYISGPDDWPEDPTFDPDDDIIW